MQSYQDVKRCVGTGVAALAAGVAVVSIGAAAGEAFMAHELLTLPAASGLPVTSVWSDGSSPLLEPTDLNGL